MEDIKEVKKKIKTPLEIRNEMLKKKAEFEKEFKKKMKELDRKEAEKKFKKLINLLIKNNNKFTDKDVQEFEKFILNILNEKSTKKEKNSEIKEISEKISSQEKLVVSSKTPLEIYLCFKKVDEENYEVYAVSSENELMTKKVIPIKYENISVQIRELCCFVDYLKYITNLQKIKDLALVKVSKLYVDNLYIVNNWTNGVVKENQNEVIKELIPIATALRKEFEELGGELIYVKPKENTARIYYKENIEE